MINKETKYIVRFPLIQETMVVYFLIVNLKNLI